MCNKPSNIACLDSLGELQVWRQRMFHLKKKIVIIFFLENSVIIDSFSLNPENFHSNSCSPLGPRRFDAQGCFQAANPQSPTAEKKYMKRPLCN